MAFEYESVERRGEVSMPRCESFPRQHANPLQMSRSESARASCENSIATSNKVKGAWDNLVTRVLGVLPAAAVGRSLLSLR